MSGSRSDATWRIRTVTRIWLYAAGASLLVRRIPLPEIIRRYSNEDHYSQPEEASPARLGRAVHRTLRVGRWRPRCLIRSLVLYRLLATQGYSPELVVGLPEEPKDHTAHAWVELTGIDVGPPPGRDGHAELARYS